MQIKSEIELIDALVLLFPQTSRRKLRRMLTEGRVKVDDTIIHKAKEKLFPGQKLKILNREKATEKSPPPPSKKRNLVKVIFEDEDILVVNKPNGLLSVATNRMESDTLHSRSIDYVRQDDKNAWCHIVHRLDRDTSGLMILAKGKKQKAHLQEQFAERSIHRVYHALVEGRPTEKSGTIKMHLFEDQNLMVKKVKSTYKGSKEAITHWRITDEDDIHTAIEIMIETGRRHQIRMAMRELGCPVVGDGKHGSNDEITRLCLHASGLEFLHPSTDDPVRFESPPPFISS